MPELPEVETICRGLAAKLLGQPISKVTIQEPNLRWRVPEIILTTLPGASFNKITRRAKYLLLATEHGTAIVHLGLTGRLIIAKKIGLARPALHEHVTITFDNGLQLRFIDSRKFGAFLWTSEDPFEHPLLKNLGPEPLSEDFTAEVLYQKTRRHKIAIKQFLMVGENVAGIGNIYASEALFLARLNPLQSAAELSLENCQHLVVAIKKVLQHALAKGGSSIRDFAHSDGSAGGFQKCFHVYGRDGQPCLICKTPIEVTRTNQRSTFYCPTCQR